MRTRLALSVAVVFTAIASLGSSHAADWPNRPIRAVVPLSGGSAADIIPRIVFEQLSAQLGQPIVIENKPGASGTIGARAVATADPDGYTLLAHSSAHIIAPSTVANMSYDPIKDSLRLRHSEIYRLFSSSRRRKISRPCKNWSRSANSSQSPLAPSALAALSISRSNDFA
jgi:tripartite-type tricarboxylate transporter receptor subunit TctC